MYEDFYGLLERPFSPGPDARFLLLTGAHREALTQVSYGIMERQPITLLLGRPGTGKTTLLRAAADRCREQGRHVAWIGNPALTRGELYEWLAMEFGLGAAARRSKAALLSELQELLAGLLARGSGGALVIDEAQSLPGPLLREVRLLANLETSTTKLLPIVLAGTPELANRLNMPQHEAVKQRVTLRCSLPPLTLAETAAYIEGRLRIAGGSGARTFTADAVRVVHAGSGGVPRLISLLCDNALIGGFAAQQRPVDAALVREVCADFDLSPRQVDRPHAGAAVPAAAATDPIGDELRSGLREPVASVAGPGVPRVPVNEAPA